MTPGREHAVSEAHTIPWNYECVTSNSRFSNMSRDSWLVKVLFCNVEKKFWKIQIQCVIIQVRDAPRTDANRSLKQGYQWSHKKDLYPPTKLKKKINIISKKTNGYCTFFLPIDLASLEQKSDWDSSLINKHKKCEFRITGRAGLIRTTLIQSHG